MKYAIISIIAISAVFALSFLSAGLVRRKLKNKPPAAVHILICIGAAITRSSANYGVQSGDGEAKITPDEQQKQTADAILKFADKINK